MNPLVGGGVSLVIAVAAWAAPGSTPPPPSGEETYRRCYACHALEPGRNSPAGPTLHAIIGRSIASEPGFDFSPALRQLASRYEVWTPELLDRFIADPETVAPGTEMGFVGIQDAGQRRALIDWLRARRPAR